MLIKKPKENPFTLFLNVTCLEFLNQEYTLQLFLNCENICVFPGPPLMLTNRSF
jgi:hypothetical protein